MTTKQGENIMTRQEAVQRLENKIATYSTDMIISILRGMAKYWKDYTEEERMVRAYLFKHYEEREGEDATDILLDIIEAMEQR